MNTKRTVFTYHETMRRPDYPREIARLAARGLSPHMLQKKLQAYHESDIAAALELLEKSARLKLYGILKDSVLADIFDYIDNIAPYMEELNIRQRAAVLSYISSDKAASYLKSLDRETRNSLAPLIENSARQDIALLQSFSPEEAGSIMTTNFIQISWNLSVKEAMKELVKQAGEHDNISTIYVVDDQDIFYGAIDLKDLILAREGAKLPSVAMTSYPYIYAHETIDDCLGRIKSYSEDSIPVLDMENRLLGVITAQDFMEILDEEMGEDYAKLGGLSSEEDLKESLAVSVKKRLPWLIILLGLGLGVSSVVGIFESVVAQLTIVVCFQSLVLDMAGNVGTQSLAVTIRVLMDENLGGFQKLSLIWKETKIGFLNGIILALISFGMIGIYTWLFKGKNLFFAFAMAGCVGTALLLSMSLAAFAGTVIPVFFKKIKIDPAVASGPLITTVNDLVAVVAYYGLAWIFLIQILHLAG